MLYEALGFNLPCFAHLPLILSKEGGRLSKRKGATAISDYHTMGYLPQALVNYLLLLGWSPGGNREVIEINEATKIFDIKNINKTAAVLDLDKLDWMNNQYLKKEDPEKLADELIPAFVSNRLNGLSIFCKVMTLLLTLSTLYITNLPVVCLPYISPT